MVAALAMGISSCSYDDLELYSGPKSGLIIQTINSTYIDGSVIDYRDSTTVSFASYAAQFKVYTLRIVVTAMGKPSNVDRKYAYSIDPCTTAVEGVDYSLDGNEFTVKAGASYDTIKVSLLRNNGLRLEEKVLKINLEENENFELPIKEYKSTASYSASGNMLSATSFKVRFSEKYTMPYYYGIFGEDFWGTWTVDKYLLLNEIMGWTISDWSKAGQTGAKVAYGKFDYAARKFRKYLQEQADNGTPVVDSATGKYMQLADSYKVDYSAYGEV